MELREIEIFLTLAEELHFGRTAERLHISPALVSHCIRKQERRIGAPLFARTSRVVRLTEVGRQLHADLQPVYVGLHESLERARMTARGITARLRVGMMPFNVRALHHYWHAFRAAHPRWELSIRVARYDDPFGQLRRGDFDALVAWLPVEEPDLTVGPTLLTDHRVLAVSGDHPLALRGSAPLETLGDFPVGSADLNLDYWEDAMLPFSTPRGRKVERILRTVQPDELINAVGMGEIVMPFPSLVSGYWALGDIRYLAMPDLPALRYALVWRTETENDAIRALAGTIRAAGVLAF